MGSVVSVINENVSSIVEKVVCLPVEKQPNARYHLYHLHGIQGRQFRQEQLRFSNETDSENDQLR